MRLFLKGLICIPAGLPHGHTGHVRFLTCVEATPEVRSSRSHHPAHHHRYSLKGKDALVSVISSTANVSLGSRMLVISGGDGYEDFRHTAFTDSVGREDSTNHLLLWQVWKKKKETKKRKKTKKKRKIFFKKQKGPGHLSFTVVIFHHQRAVLI